MYVSVCDFGLAPLDKSAYVACPVINSNSVVSPFLAAHHPRSHA